MKNQLKMSPDKILYPGLMLTKHDITHFYAKIAPYLLRHAKGRPLSMKRFPNGITHKGFFQKQVGHSFPSWIETVDVPLKTRDEVQRQVVLTSKRTLLFLASQAVIEPHIWLSMAGKLTKPDRLVFDLDPPSNDEFALARRGALLLKKILEADDLHPFVMTSGGKGLHVVVPIKPLYEFEDVRKYALEIAKRLASIDKEHFTVTMSKAKRGQRAFVDYLRNSYGQTTIAPYALRARLGAPVATPLAWEELNDTKLHAQSYHIGNIFKRLQTVGDPWLHIRRHTKKLPLRHA